MRSKVSQLTHEMQSFSQRHEQSEKDQIRREKKAVKNGRKRDADKKQLKWKRKRQRQQEEKKKKRKMI